MLVNKKDIIGIFDLDTTTTAKKTRDFLKIRQSKGEINTISDLPKSFVVVKNKGKKYGIIINKLSSKVLLNNIEEASRFYCF